MKCVSCAALVDAGSVWHGSAWWLGSVSCLSRVCRVSHLVDVPKIIRIVMKCDHFGLVASVTILNMITLGVWRA